MHLAGLEGGAQVGGPADVVEASLGPRRLPVGDALVDAGDVQFLGGERRREGKDGKHE